jgi:hypothetical protein
MANVANINDVLDGHVALEVECVDRIYLNAYVANLQVAGQVVRFLTDHLGNPVPSPALFEKIGNRFRREVDAFAKARGVPRTKVPFRKSIIVRFTQSLELFDTMALKRGANSAGGKVEYIADGERRFGREQVAVNFSGPERGNR